MDETTVVDEALAPQTFDVLSFIEGTAYPEETVTILTDIATAREYVALVNGEDKYDEADAEALRVKLADTALNFKLRGFPPGMVEEILEKYASDEDPSGADAHLIAKAIVGVTNAKGEPDARLWSPDDVIKLKRFLAEGEYVKLLTSVANIIFNAAVFDRAVDAGFPR